MPLEPLRGSPKSLHPLSPMLSTASLSVLTGRACFEKTCSTPRRQKFKLERVFEKPTQCGRVISPQNPVWDSAYGPSHSELRPAPESGNVRANRIRLVIIEICLIFSLPVCEDEQKLGARFHGKVRWGHTPSATGAFSSSKRVPGSTRARKPAMTTGCTTSASTFTH